MNPNLTKWKQRAARTAALVLLAVLPGTGIAQQAPALSHRAEKARKAAYGLVLNAPISVVKVHGREEFGRFQSRNDEGFTFYDVDLKSDVTLKYEDVRKIKHGYGRLNSVSHRHTDRTRGLIVAAVVLGVLGGVIAAAASARN